MQAYMNECTQSIVCGQRVDITFAQVSTNQQFEWNVKRESVLFVKIVGEDTENAIVSLVSKKEYSLTLPVSQLNYHEI